MFLYRQSGVALTQLGAPPTIRLIAFVYSEARQKIGTIKSTRGGFDVSGLERTWIKLHPHPHPHKELRLPTDSIFVLI